MITAVISMKMRNAKLSARARELRKNATPQENHLWYDFLRTYPVQFKRQAVISHFIVDFYCPAAKLVVELDGSQHFSDQGAAYDNERDSVITAFGCKVLRFSNHDINTQFRAVCDEIDRVVRTSGA